MEKSPLLTIIIPVYNTEPDLLKRAIDSAFSQKKNPVEVLVIDDCSTSAETRQVLQSFEQEEKVRVLYNEKNLGISGTRNRGIREAEGEFLAFLDHDDSLHDDFASIMVRKAVEDNCDLVICGWEAANPEGTITRHYPENDSYYNDPWFIWASGLIWTHIYRKKVLLEKNILFPDHCVLEDSVFCLRCADLIQNVGTVPFIGYTHYEYEVSASHSERFHALRYDQIPFDYLEDIVKNVRQPDYTIGTAVAILPLITCLSTWKSDIETQKACENRSREILKESPHFLRRTQMYFKKIPSDPKFRYVALGYLVACCMHSDKIYCRAVRFLLSHKEA